MYEAGTIITLRSGAYCLREPLAQSVYGVLWRAEGPPGVGEVALKLVNRCEMARAPAALRACWVASANAERAFLSSLQPWDQRHILRLLDSGMHEGLPALALDLLDTDLARHAAAARDAGRVLPFARILDWVAQVNQALATVHRCGWRYLDLKPGNLLLDAQGKLKLADFGTIRPLDDRDPHAFSGTPTWQAPEQFFPNALGRYDTDARTDYFALGALFYFLACGEALRFCRDCGEAHRTHGMAAAARMAARAGIPPALRPDEAARFVRRVEHDAPGAGQQALALLRTLLAPLREQRPRHALDISRALSRIAGAARCTQPCRSAA
jgi:serine/threonine-protein kinase